LSRLFLQYPGSKWRLGKEYVQHFPAHCTYVDVCGGTAALFTRKPPSTIEIYNDIDANLFNVFEVLQDTAGYEELLRLLENTPNARQQYEICKKVTVDPTATKVRRAWAFLVCGAIGFSGHPVVQNAWVSPRHGKHKLLKLPEYLRWWRDRFRRVHIECKPWQEVLDPNDAPDTFFFVDPPYVPAVLRHNHDTYYVCSMDTAEHMELIERLRRIQGYAFLCGYNHPLYTERLFHWRKLTFQVTPTMGGKKREKRTECAWLNYENDGSKIEGNRLRIAKRYITIMGGEEEARKYLERVAQLRRLPK
jgi:DNA adenine methylase